MSKHKRIYRERGLLALIESFPVWLFPVSVLEPVLQALAST